MSSLPTTTPTPAPAPIFSPLPPPPSGAFTFTSTMGMPENVPPPVPVPHLHLLSGSSGYIETVVKRKSRELKKELDRKFTSLEQKVGYEVRQQTRLIQFKSRNLRRALAIATSDIKHELKKSNKKMDRNLVLEKKMKNLEAMFVFQSTAFAAQLKSNTECLSNFITSLETAIIPRIVESVIAAQTAEKSIIPEPTETITTTESISTHTSTTIEISRGITGQFFVDLEKNGGGLMEIMFPQGYKKEAPDFEASEESVEAEGIVNAGRGGAGGGFCSIM